MVDEEVELLCGDGRVVRGRFVAPNQLIDAVVEHRATGLPPMVVVQAMVKQDKLEVVAQKATELGASSLWLFDAARSNARVDDERGARKVERLHRIALDGARQADRADAMTVDGPMTFAAMLARTTTAIAEGQLVVIGALHGSVPLSSLLIEQRGWLVHGLIIIVGPEGGLDDNECARLSAVGAHVVRWSAHVLRTETAALAALAIAQAAVGQG
jgi:16S rRNA (uracil1498-N3)-methyltransferase